MLTLNKGGRAITHRQTRRQGYSIQLNKETGLANLGKHSLWRNSLQEQRDMVDISAHGQHLLSTLHFLVSLAVPLPWSKGVSS